MCLEIKKFRDDIQECIDNTSEDDCESLIDSYVKIPYYTDSGDLYAQIKQCGIQCKGELIHAYLDMFLKNCIVRLNTDFGDKYSRVDDCRASCSGMVFISKEEYDEVKKRLEADEKGYTRRFR